jgi:Rrf2 family protein
MLPKTAEYALRTVAYLAGVTEQVVSADELAVRTQVPRRYLNTVLQDLGKAGIVRSKSGPGGGHKLAVSAEELSILDVVNAVSPLERIKSCPLGLPSHTHLCPLHEQLDRAYAATEKAFADVTLAQVLASTNGVTPLCDVLQG